MPLMSSVLADEGIAQSVKITQSSCLPANWSLPESFVGDSIRISKFQPDPSASIFVIGMRGAGKTTSGRWIATHLSLQFVDLDAEIERRNGLSVSDIVRQHGWDVFRARELEVLEDMMRTRATGYVFSCGGGIVETTEARDLLKGWGGTVLLVHRNTDAMVDYLLVDKTRPVYTERIREVYERRKPWLDECSNAMYLSTHSDVDADRVPSDLARLLDMVSSPPTEETFNPEVPHSLDTFKITGSDIEDEAALSSLAEASQACDVIELRIDVTENITPDTLATQIAQVRRICGKPIIFAARWSGGVLRGPKHQKLFDVHLLAMKMCVEFMAVHPTLSADVIQRIASARRRSRMVIDNFWQTDDTCGAQKSAWHVKLLR